MVSSFYFLLPLIFNHDFSFFQYLKKKRDIHQKTTNIQYLIEDGIIVVREIYMAMVTDYLGNDDYLGTKLNTFLLKCLYTTMI